MEIFYAVLIIGLIIYFSFFKEPAELSKKTDASLLKLLEIRSEKFKNALRSGNGDQAAKELMAVSDELRKRGYNPNNNHKKSDISNEKNISISDPAANTAGSDPLDRVARAKFGKPIDEIKAKLDKGDPVALYEFAISVGLVFGIEKSINLMQQSAIRGHVPAQYALGMAHIDKSNKNPDPVSAVKWMKIAADHGDENALKGLSVLNDHLPKEVVSEGIKLAGQEIEYYKKMDFDF